MTLKFTHLRIHTEYSIADGLVRLDDVMDAAAADGQPAIAITDLMNLFAMVKFYKGSRSRGIKPIIGCDVAITNVNNRAKPSRLLLFAKNRIGYLQLCELLSRAYLENQHNESAEIRVEWLEALRDNGSEPALIALSGAHFGDIGMCIASGDIVGAEKCAERWEKIFPEHFYVEIQRAGQPNMETQVAQSISLAERLRLPVVATHPVQFMKPDEFMAHEARTCIASSEMLSNPKRAHLFNQGQCFKTQEEMAVLFADMPIALANSVEIAKRCNVHIELNKPRLPDFPVPDGVTADQFLESEAQEGLVVRLKQLYPDPVVREAQRCRYESRLKFETDTIIKMGFPGYFLIVAEFIRWAKNNGVPVGPGRGSGAGSLVAYSLLITDLDPLAYNLLFERFLNPDRVSMPDFDIDFCQEGRDRVIQHVKDLYGKDAVSQIATFGTMAAKGAIRDIGRVLNLGYNFCDGISKLIPFRPGKPVTIAGAIEEEPLLADRQKNEEDVRNLLSLAQQVEGITRNIGMHAGGVLIAPGKLTDFCPVYTQGGDSGVVSQFDKDDVEAVGLVKFDFLGLTTLTILDRAVRYIKMMHPSLSDFALDKLPMDDKPSYELLTAAKTVAVFQLESRGMQGMLKEARPDRFEDIIALVALYRPGPMDLIPDFCRRKHGEPFHYPDPRTEGILSETYGIMVYQEQVMQMAQVVGGYTLGGADLLRRAMGKKKFEEMAEHRQIFRDGAAKDGLSELKADEIFNLMEKFAGYGFNKSHAAAYALLSYHTAYLKTHFPAEFMAANLSLAMDDTDKVKILYEDAIDVCGIEFLPPSINDSMYHFMPIGEKGKVSKQIRYGLGAIKGSGQNAIEAIVLARQQGPFKDLFDFANRVDKKLINRRTVDSLIRAGAFDSFGTERATLLASVALAMEGAQQARAAIHQVSLFDDEMDQQIRPNYVEAVAWGEKRKLTEEKAALGFYVSGHLFDEYAKEAGKFARIKLSEITSSRDSQLIAGVISEIRVQPTQRGKIVVVTLDDNTSTVNVTMYAEVYEANKKLIKEDEFLTVLGKVSDDKFTGGLRIIADKIWDIHSARHMFGTHISMMLPESVDFDLIKGVLTPHCSKKGLPVVIKRQIKNAEYNILLPEEWKIVPNEMLTQKLYQTLGAKEIVVGY
jgi:DNA polymerase-3 subunit alpha